MTPRNGGIIPCIIDTCRYPTRTFRAKAETYPFPTRTRRKGMCHVCHYATIPKAPAPAPKPAIDPDKPPNRDTLAAHDAFLAGRKAREERAARIKQAAKRWER